MYIRFATHRRDETSGAPLGIFGAAYDLLREDWLGEHDSAELQDALDWFDRHLPRQRRFARTRRPHRTWKGICWFKSSAGECESRIRYVVHLVREEGVPVCELRTSNPGYVIYEDEHQMVAEPFATTPT